jgi:hypothetical protein
LITRTRHIRKLRPSILFQYCQAPCGTRSSSSPPVGLVSPPHQRAWRRRPRPGSPRAVSSSWRLGFTAGLGALGFRRCGPSHESRGGLACNLLRDASTLAVGLPLHVIEAEGPVGAAMASRCRSNTGAYRRMHPERPASGPGQRGPPYPWPFRKPDAPLSGRSGGSPPGWSTARTEVKALLTSSSMEMRSSRLRMYAARLHSCCMTINGISVKKKAKTLGVENFNSPLILWSHRAIFLDVGCQRVQLIHSCIILSLCRHLSKEIVAISAIGSKA